MNACTIVARNYLPFARVLARSFLHHHPQAAFTVLVVDDEDGGVPDETCFRVTRPADIGLSRLNVHRMASIYDVTELSTALKPVFLRHLRQVLPPTVLYLDPDIWVHASLAHLAERAEEHGIVLTPHRTLPSPSDDRTPTEGDLLSAGVFNLGFIALGPETDPFLDWWSARLRLDAVRDIAHNLFTDQRSIDMVPAYFSHYVVRDEGCNVAYWNLDSRDLIWTGDRYEVNGVPLRFFHFSGFRPETPQVLTFHHAARPRVLLSGRPTVAKICREYAELLREAGYGTHQFDYAYDVLPNGLHMDATIRSLYRRTLIAAERGEASPPPDPFDADQTTAFLDWLRQPVGGPRARPLSRYLLELHRSSHHLHSEFDLDSPAGADAYVDWILRWGRYEQRIPDVLLPSRSRRRRRLQGPPPQGVNVAAYFRAETGVGEAGRAVLRAVEASAQPHRTILHDVTLSRQAHPFVEDDHMDVLYDTNLVCVNADAFPNFARQVGAEFFRNRYTIGLWHWEVEVFPWEMHDAFRYVQEVWTASEFSRQSVAKVAPCPVFAFPLPIVPAHPPTVTRAELDLPEAFMFLFVFDYLSVFARKNPTGVVKAFREAFAPGEGPVLVIKSINGEQNPPNREVLRAALADRPDIMLIEHYLDHDRSKALMATCDCYVSLHRSEGFGLTMAEAMSFGRPVIATGYSGNLEFMNADNSYLVPYELVPIGPGADPYPPQAAWAAPDVHRAAALMREVYEHPDEAAARGRRAREDITALHGPETRAPFIDERAAVGRRLTGSGLQPSSPVRRFVVPGPGLGSAARLPARIVLRLMSPLIEVVRRPNYRHRRAATVVKRILRRPYQAIWRAGHSPSGKER